MLDHSCQVQRHTLAERGDDLYETPDVAVLALLRVEELPNLIWEPACGPGRIVRVLRDRGHKVWATDLVDYNCPLSTSRQDFLMAQFAPFGIEAILTNPPYKLAEQFVAKAIDLCPKVIMLLRLAFLESDRRRGILDNGMLARVHVFRKRLPMMHREGWEGRKANSGMAFAWFIWDRGHQGPTIINRISWEESQTDATEPPRVTEPAPRFAPDDGAGLLFSLERQT